MPLNTPKWLFPPHQAGYVAQDPIQRAFFTTEKVGGLEQALVREAIQNALDARSAADPVMIRFAISTVEPNAYGPYFAGLKPHLRATFDGSVAGTDLSKPMDFLIIEDLNTTGLEGDAARRYIQDPEESQNFYYFWRNIGRTGKSEGHRGRWGLGKTVFPATSTLATFFGLTCRESDGKRMLMGQSVLKYHTVDGETYTPYGYFGVFPEEAYFAMPVSDDEAIERFRATFGVLRKHQPGLSLIIPQPVSDISIGRLGFASIYQYYYAILVGDLHLVFNEQNVDSGNLEDFARRIPATEFPEHYDKDTFLRTLRCVRWAIGLEDDGYIKLDDPDLRLAPNWRTYLRQEQIELARERFAEDGRIAFKVGTKVSMERGRSRRRQQAQIGWFKVFVERDEQLSKAESHYLRNGIRLVEVKGHSLRGIRALCVIDDPLLSQMLGDAENPAHTEWQKDAPSFQQYEHGPSTLSFVKSSLAHLAGQLTRRGETIEKDLLKEIFYLEETPESQLSAKAQGGVAAHKRDEGVTDARLPELPHKEQPLASRRIPNGVEITSTDTYGDGTGPVTVRFAYEVRHGNPFQKYNPLDFDLSDPAMEIEAKNVTIASRAKNQLTFDVVSTPFSLRVTGFDSLRDVVLKVTWNEDEA